MRGTHPHDKEDLGHDASIARFGTTIDKVGGYLQSILDDTDPSRIVDVGAHVLVAEAYKNRPDLQNLI